MTRADVIFLAHTGSDALHRMTLEAIRTLRASEADVDFVVTVMESNPRWDPLRHPYENCQVLQPGGPFNYNKFCNIGIQATRNPWVALCNNDLVFHPGWFREILKVHADDPSLQSFSPFNEHEGWHPTLFEGAAPALSVNYRVNYEVAGWCLVIRREVLCRITLSERVSFWYSDDVFAEALNRNGIRHCLVKASKVDHLGRATDTQSAHFKTVRKLLDSGMAGDNVGLLLRGIDKEDVERGQVLAKPGSITPHKKFLAQVYVLKKEEGGRHKAFFTGYRPQFYVRTMDVTGNITLPEGIEMVMPGDNVNLTVELIVPVALEQGSKFAIREGGLTVGSGVVTKILE